MFQPFTYRETPFPDYPSWSDTTDTPRLENHQK